jgi:hypothetical protein
MQTEGEIIDFSSLAGKPTGKRTLARPRRRWAENIRTNLKETSVNASNWIHTAQIGIIRERH